MIEYRKGDWARATLWAVAILAGLGLGGFGLVAIGIAIINAIW